MPSTISRASSGKLSSTPCFRRTARRYRRIEASSLSITLEAQVRSRHLIGNAINHCAGVVREAFLDAMFPADGQAVPQDRGEFFVHHSGSEGPDRGAAAIELAESAIEGGHQLAGNIVAVIGRQAAAPDYPQGLLPRQFARDREDFFESH